MNKRQKKKAKYKDMWLLSFKWKSNREIKKIMEGHKTYQKFYWNKPCKGDSNETGNNN